MSQTTVTLNNQESGNVSLYLEGRNLTVQINGSMTVAQFLALAAEKNGVTISTGKVEWDVVEANGDEYRVTSPDTQQVGPGASVIAQARHSNG